MQKNTDEGSKIKTSQEAQQEINFLINPFYPVYPVNLK